MPLPLGFFEEATESYRFCFIVFISFSTVNRYCREAKLSIATDRSWHATNHIATPETNSKTTNWTKWNYVDKKSLKMIFIIKKQIKISSYLWPAMTYPIPSLIPKEKVRAMVWTDVAYHSAVQKVKYFFMGHELASTLCQQLTWGREVHYLIKSATSQGWEPTMYSWLPIPINF